MSELTDCEPRPENRQATDAFRRDIDALRRMLPAPRSRSRAIDFRMWSKSTPAHRTAGDNAWDVKVAGKRLMYDIRKASADGRLVLYSHFVRYDTEGWMGSLTAPLFTTQVSFDAVTATARPTSARRLNTQLIDVLKTLGVEVDASGDTPTLSGRSAIASLEGDDRVAAAAPTPLQPSAYLDHEASPALLDNRLLRLFVERSASETSASAIHAGRPDGLPASEGNEVEPSERRPQAVQAATADMTALDTDQRAAVEMAMSMRACVIKGPPGTGKSQVIAAIAHRSAAQQMRVLVTSTERSAIDVAARRTAGIEGVLAMTIDEAAAIPPATIGVADFDILMIDEASRMTLAEAATVIARARSVVIIGDERQLRPETDDETVLDRALSLGLAHASLTFHYRSKERSLITTSNMLSYGMKLRTVPTPSLDPALGLRVALVDGLAVETTQGTENPVEAHLVIQRLKKHAATKDPRSIAVITSNRTQRDLVRRMVKETMTKAQIDALTPISQEELLIASATECQGEERDIVLISTVYDRSSKRFGIFGKKTAIPAMNVMLSRAKQEMSIITSYRPTSGNRRTDRAPAATVMDALFLCTEAATTTETRQAPPAAFVSLAQRLSMRIDHLGVVMGLRQTNDRSYRLGILPISDHRTAEDWDMIDRHLRSVGWKTIRLTEVECRRAPSEVNAKVRSLLTE